MRMFREKRAPGLAGALALGLSMCAVGAAQASKAAPPMAFAFVEAGGARLLTLRTDEGAAPYSELSGPESIGEAFCPGARHFRVRFVGKHQAKRSGECEKPPLTADDACLLAPKGYFTKPVPIPLVFSGKPCAETARRGITAKSKGAEVRRCAQIAGSRELSVYKALLHRPAGVVSQEAKWRGETEFAWITAVVVGGVLSVEAPVFNDEEKEDSDSRCAMFQERAGTEGVLFAFSSGAGMLLARSYAAGPVSSLALWKVEKDGIVELLSAQRRWCHL